MAYYFIFPEKDATVYSHPNRTKLNTGGDEIIEVVKEKQVETDEAWYCQDSSLFELVDSHVLLEKSMLFRANAYHTVHNNSNEKRCVVSWPFKELDWDRIVEYAGKNFN